MNTEIEIRTFDGNLDALSQLIASSWHHDYSRHHQSVIKFTIPYLKWNLYNPLSDNYFHIGAYHEDKLVGFAASFPRNYEYFSRENESYCHLSGVFSTYFTTHQDYRRQGIGTKLAKERIRRHIERGVDINLFFQDNGHSSSKVYPKFSNFMNSNYSTLASIDFLIRVLDMNKLCKLEYFSKFQEKLLSCLKFMEHIKPQKTSSNNIRKFKGEDIDTCLNLVNSFNKGTGLYRRWTKEELLWELKNELSSTLVYTDNGNVTSFINYHILDMVGRTEQRTSQIDNIFIHNLTLKQQKELVCALLAEMKTDGVIMAMVPRLPYFDSGPFYLNRFFPYSRKQHLKLLNYSDDKFIENSKTIYTYYR